MEEEVLNKYYSSKEGLLTRYDDSFYIRTAKDQYRWIQSNSALDKVKSIFEIGCGRGYLLSEFRKNMDKSLKIMGIEPDLAAANFGSKNLNLHIEQGMLETFRPEIKYDLVILSHVLEHVLDPVKFLNNVLSNYLSPGGVLFIEVPSSLTEIPLIKLWDGTSRYYLGMSAAEHTLVFSKESFLKLCQMTNCRIQIIEDCSSHYIRSLSSVQSIIYKSAVTLEKGSNSAKLLISACFSALKNALMREVLLLVYSRSTLLKNSGLRILVQSIQ